MYDIDKITNAWAKWKSAQYRTTFWFTESTQYKRNKDTVNYMEHQTNVTAPKNLTYSSAHQADGGAALLGGYDVENYSSLPIEHTISLQQGIEDTFTWSITESVKVGMTVKMTVGIPFANGETSFNTEIALSSTQGKTIKKSSNYGTSAKINVAPHTRGWGNVDLSFIDTSTNWVGNVEMNGRVAIWFNDKVDVNRNGDLHHLWFFSIESVFNECIKHNLISTQGYIVKSNSVVAQAKGSFQGSKGMNVSIIAREEPLVAIRKEQEEVGGIIAVSNANDPFVFINADEMVAYHG